MKRTLIKFFAAAVCAVAFAFSLGGCGRGWFIDTDEDEVDERMEKLIDCLEERDGDGLKSLFAADKIAQISDFDKDAEQLLNYYGGDFLSKTRTVGTDESIDHGHATKDYSISCDVTTTECVYRFGIDWRVRDTDNKNNLGIWSLYCIKFDDDPFKNYDYWGDGYASAGIHVGKTYSPDFIYNSAWSDAGGKMNFRTVSRGVGSGTLGLGGNRIQAQFVFSDGKLSVSAFKEDLNDYSGGEEKHGVITESVEFNQFDRDGNLKSKGEAVLFGENLGALSLTHAEFETEEDYGTVEEWEYCNGWQANLPVNSGGYCVFTLDEPCRGYFKRRCWTATIYSGGEEAGKAIFKWLPQDGFAFYAYDGRGFVDDGASALAEGTYEEQYVDYDLHFTKNDLFEGDLSGLNMRRLFSERVLPQ